MHLSLATEERKVRTWNDEIETAIRRGGGQQLTRWIVRSIFGRFNRDMKYICGRRQSADLERIVWR